jgi:hypothetical protein
MTAFHVIRQRRLYAPAAFFMLRARATRKSNSRNGLTAAVRCTCKSKTWVAAHSVRFLKVAQFSLRAQRKSAIRPDRQKASLVIENLLDAARSAFNTDKTVDASPITEST